MWRRTAGLIILCLATAVLGAATSLAISSATLGAASVATPRCTSAGLGILHNVTAGNVVSVAVTGIPAACGGALVQATVNNGITSGSGSATAPAAGGGVTVTLGLVVPVTTAAQTDIVLVGP
jgi:hypothetical protein